MSRIFKNRVLRTIFGTDGEKATECWGKLHNEVLQDTYCSAERNYGDKWKAIEMCGTCSMHGGEENCIYS